MPYLSWNIAGFDLLNNCTNDNVINNICESFKR